MDVNSIAVGDDAGRDACTYSTSVAETYLRLDFDTESVGDDIRHVRFSVAHEPFAVGAVDGEVKSTGSELPMRHFVQKLIDAFDCVLNRCVRVTDIFRSEERSGDFSVGGDNHFTDVGKLCSGLGDEHRFTIEVGDLFVFNHRVGMSVKYHINTSCGSN